MYAQKSLVRLSIKEIDDIKKSLADDFNKKVDQLEDLQTPSSSRSAEQIAAEEKSIYQDLVTLSTRLNIIEITGIFRKTRTYANLLLIACVAVSLIGIGIIFFTIYNLYSLGEDIISAPVAETGAAAVAEPDGQAAEETKDIASSIGSLAIIPNAIGALLFVLYFKVIDQYKYFYEKLDNALDIKIANLYIKSVSSPALKKDLQKAFVENLLKRSSEELKFLTEKESDGQDETSATDDDTANP